MTHYLFRFIILVVACTLFYAAAFALAFLPSSSPQPFAAAGINVAGLLSAMLIEMRRKP